MELSWSIRHTIASLREKVGLTQEELAKESGISRKHLMNVESGMERVSIDIIHKIANGLGLSLIELLEMVDIDGVRSYKNPHYEDDNKTVELTPEQLLFYKGDKTLLKSPKKLTIIGKKKPTEHGLRMSQALTSWFIKRGYIVVSGIEEGIDSMVHETCLDNGGKSIAVLNSGIRGIVQKKSKELADKIVKAGGLLLTKYSAPTFPKLTHNLDSRILQVKIGYGVILVESQLGSSEMKAILHLIKEKKEKKKIYCVTPLMTDYNKAQGNFVLIRNHPNTVIELTEESILESK